MVLSNGEYVICINDYDFKTQAVIAGYNNTCGIFQKCNMVLMAVVVLEHPVLITAW